VIKDMKLAYITVISLYYCKAEKNAFSLHSYTGRLKGENREQENHNKSLLRANGHYVVPPLARDSR